MATCFTKDIPRLPQLGMEAALSSQCISSSWNVSTWISWVLRGPQPGWLNSFIAVVFVRKGAHGTIQDRSNVRRKQSGDWGAQSTGLKERFAGPREEWLLTQSLSLLGLCFEKERKGEKRSKTAQCICPWCMKKRPINKLVEVQSQLPQENGHVLAEACPCPSELQVLQMTHFCIP